MVKPSKSSSSDNSIKKNKFAAYDFDVEDDRVEKDSQKFLSKFKYRNPSKFSTSPVDKYRFLRSFAQGTKTVKNDFENEPLDVDDYYHDIEERICKLDAAVSSPSDREELAHSPLHSSRSFSGENSCARKGRKPGGSVTDNKHLQSFGPQIISDNQPVCVDSDDEQVMKEFSRREPICVGSDDDLRNDLTPSNLPSNHAGDEGSLEKQPSDHDSNALVCEPSVVVNPDCIILGDMYSTTSMLTFSRGFIKLEGPIFEGAKRASGFNWPISDIVKITSFWCREVETVMVVLHVKSKDEKVAEMDSRFSGIIKLNVSVNDPKWCERQETIESLDSRYKAIWNTVVHIDPIWSEFSLLEEKSKSFSEECSANEVFQDVIYPEGDPDAVSISKKDIELLQPATFINDTIIDFYIKYLRQNMKPDQKHRFHFFNSFFFRKLADLDKDLSTACEGRAAFQRVRKWTRKVNMFEKDFLFIPVNFSLHWSLVVVCHPGEAAYCRDEVAMKSSKFSCILHMDSIRGYHRGLKNLFQSYLWEEWKERHNDLSEDVYTNFLNLPFITLELPQQENSFDCGLFLLYYVERFLQQAPVNFSPVNDASNFLNKDWFQPEEASSRRDYIKKLIYKIYNENADKHPPAADDEAKYSSNNVVEGDSGKGFLLEKCDGSEAYRAEIQKTSHAATTPGQSLQYMGGRNCFQRDISGERTYHHRGKMESFKQTCNFMSPIEEEEATGERKAFSSTQKAGGLNAAATVLEVAVNLDYEGVEHFTGRSPISLELQDEEESVPEVLLVSASEERSKKNETCSTSSEELSCCIVEDSEEENGMIVISDDVHSHFREARSCDLYDLEVDSPCTRDEKSK